MGRSRACSAVLGRFEGPEARELSILCRPVGATGDADLQADSVYRELTAVLAAEQGSFSDLTCETLFVRDVGRDVPLLLRARERVLAEAGQWAEAPAPSIIGQAPASRNASFELVASVVTPHRRDARAVRDVRSTPACPCDGCARSGARLHGLGGQTSLDTTNVYGTGATAFDEALDMFHRAEHLLERCGMEFRDVVRTWIHLRDIDRDYDALNAARREFFRRCGVDPRPASTGVQGIPFPDAHDFSLRLHALRSSDTRIVVPISTPSLNEAWSYGADFSRGLRVVEANRVTLHVSGTASIDEAGRTVHVDDLEGQARRMLHNVESLLARQGATFGDVLSGVLYLRTADDAPMLRSLCRACGFDGFPCALVEAPLCRPELLCEVEVVAALPLEPARA